MKQNFVCFNNMVHKNTIKFILKHGGFNKIIRATCFFINDKIKKHIINVNNKRLPCCIAQHANTIVSINIYIRLH